LKGRLQHAIRKTAPKAFRRNYRLESVGSAKRNVIEAYVCRQLERHPMADPRVQSRLVEFQISQSHVDLSHMRYSAHGQFMYNLHVVVEHQEDWPIVEEAFLSRTRDTLLGICRKKELKLSEAGIVSNHLHVALGCNLEMSPLEVGLGLLNNLAYAHGMKRLYKFGAYTGTFGNYDLGAIWNKQRGS
jgi:REP element-mobilizing transposase RayT